MSCCGQGPFEVPEVDGVAILRFLAWRGPFHGKFGFHVGAEEAYAAMVGAEIYGWAPDVETASTATQILERESRE